MFWISVVVLSLTTALIQLGAASAKVSMLTIALKCLGGLFIVLLLVAGVQAIWQRYRAART